VDQTFLSNFGCDTEQELRNTIRYDLESALGNSVESAMRSQIADYLLSNTVLDVPAGISRRQTEKLIARRILEMYEANIPRPEIAKAVDEMQARVHEQAVRDLKLYFVLEKIADAMDIDVSEEEINSAIARIARRSNQRFDRVRDELSKRDGLASMYVFMRDRKVLDTLLQQAAITEIEGPKDESTT
jgi:trigger factor